LRKSGLDVENLKLPTPELAESLERFLDTREQQEATRKSENQAALQVLTTLQRTWQRRRKVVEESRLAKERLDRQEAARRKIDEQIRRARELVNIANAVQKTVIAEVFNESLNRLWNDLFSRLVKVEPFRITLQELKVVARKLRVRFAATCDEVSFDQPGSVLSSGNLNTAALSLFPALNLIEQPRHHVLVLDDPVQNMDEIHFIHFAEVLRELARTSGRQLVMALHDRPLFEYLCLELGPTRPEQSLLAIQLDRDPVTFQVTLLHERNQWTPDELQFG
jgi:exonuclease SbcC